MDLPRIILSQKTKKNKKQKTKTDEQKTVSKDSIIYIPFV